MSDNHLNQTNQSPNNGERKLIVAMKYNLGPKPPGMAFRTRDLEAEAKAKIIAQYAADLTDADQSALAQQLYRVEWLGEVDVDADAAVAATGKRERGPSNVEQATKWLPTFLGGYAWPSSEVFEAAAKLGYSRDMVFKAKKRLETIKAVKRGWNTEWWWGVGDVKTLPERPAQAATSNGSDTSDTSDTSIWPGTTDSPSPSNTSDISDGSDASATSGISPDLSW